ncbi:GTP cyclohydrolase II [Pigmentiphaga aceris]|uniref:GTP cyclohydrolase II n=2 Tax=Pigmentiphaga aceris TaxID=1940612 RepID=A0A5C0B650_9BURK|nr:GTP cyclohydrolase II [Pigmentiphaga aceris]
MKMVTVRQRVDIPLQDVPVTPDFVSFEGVLKEHIALVFPSPVAGTTPLVRVHSECITGEVFGSQLCDCGPQLREALALIARQGGVLLYLRQEGRGIGLYAKLQAYSLQKQGLDTFEANRHLNLPEDSRSFEDAAKMLDALGINKIRLLTNNPDKQAQLEQYGIEIEDIVPTGVYLNPHNRRYLEAKVKLRDHKIAF